MRNCTLRLLPRADVAALRSVDALATSSNAGLVGNANPNFWRFAGRRNADGAIHRAAGPELLRACADIADDDGSRCRIGEAVVTPAFGSLRAEMVIHAVAPDGAYAVGLQRWWGRRQWSGSAGATAVYLQEAQPHGTAEELLAQTYTAVLQAADESGVKAVGLPAIGCGVLGFGPERACGVALGAIAAHVALHSSVERLDVAFHSDEAFNGWRKRTRALIGEPVSEGGEAEVYDLSPMIEACALSSVRSELN